ncbi:MAG: restriction endonuclease subunit S [Acinetobacter sp.]
MSKTVAKYQKYAEYKDSGFEAFGQIPSHWEVLNLRYVFDFLNEKRFPLSALERAEKKGQYPYYGASGIIDYVDEYVLNEKTILIAEDGANLLSRSTPLAFIADGKYWVNNHAHILKPKNLQFHFWTYFLQSVDFTIYITGSAQPKLSRENLGDVVLLKPSLNEQQVIAKFLDHETAKIDTLIDKQKKLIELLKEKRQAVISHAVTKGLNPNVAMKNSGVEWLGQVPEHWTVSKFGYISQVVRGGSPRPAGDPTLFNGDYSPWVTVAEITKDNELYLTSTETFLTKKGSEQCRVFQAGTLLLSNSGATLGVPKILSINVNANDGVVGFEDLRIDTEYGYFYLSVLTNDLRERVKQGSGQPNLNTDIVKAISITVPPENEIKEIVADIKKKINHFAKLMKSAENAIQLMQERRIALISSVVTGKIDVRNWQNPNNNNEVKTEFGA